MKNVFLILTASLFLCGCGSTTTERMVSGAALGAVVGGAVAAGTGNDAATGAVIGAGGGAAACVMSQ